MSRSVLAPLFVAVAACCLLAAAQAAQPRFQRIRSILTLGDSVADAGKLLLPALQAVAAHYRCHPQSGLGQDQAASNPRPIDLLHCVPCP